MENHDVVSFVERFRKQCSSASSYSLKGSRVVPSQTNIAHLLCEEARYRWLGICEEEDVMIDDVSCVVLEFPVQPGSHPETIPDRSVGRTLSLGPDDDPSLLLAGKHVDSRGTLVDNPENEPDTLITLADMSPREVSPSSTGRMSVKPAAVRNDFMRGSLARDRSDVP